MDCAEPKSGDNHYGYCRIPGSQEFYVWGECAQECPDGPYPDIQIMTVSAADSDLFREVIDGRDLSLAERNKGFTRGGILGGVGVTLGVPGVIGACISAGSWSFGTGCGIVLGLIAIDAIAASLEVKDGWDAHTDLTEQNGFDDSAQDLFEQLRDEQDMESGDVP